MPNIGLQYFVGAPIKETKTSVSYNNGFVISNAIKAEVSIDMNEAILSADNRIVENIKEFKSGKLVLNGDHLTYTVISTLLGHEVSEMPGGGEMLTAKGDDDGQFVGVGFYATSIKSGVRKFRAIWLSKVKFGIPSESLETKGEGGINFQTPTLEGTVLTDIFGVWKTEALFATEAEAESWLNEKADIAESVMEAATRSEGSLY